MAISDGDKFLYSRRAFGKLALAGLPLTLALRDLEAFAAIDSKINGVQIGAITYSFRSIPSADEIIKAYVSIGLGEMELMSNHAEMLAGAPIPAPPAGRGRGTGAPPRRRSHQRRRHLRHLAVPQHRAPRPRPRRLRQLLRLRRPAGRAAVDAR